MHNTTIMQIVLLNNMRRSTIHQRRKRSTGSPHTGVHKLALARRGPHLPAEGDYRCDGGVVSASDGAADPVDEEGFGALYDGIW